MAPREPDVSALTTLDSLILAQAVYELGGDSWAAVAKVLSKHPLISHPKSFFTAQSCQAFYRHLLKESSLEVLALLLLRILEATPTEYCSTEADTSPHGPLNLKLAKSDFKQDITNFLIGEQEEEFKTILKEIEEIRSAKDQPTQEIKEEDSSPKDSVTEAGPSTTVTPPPEKTDTPTEQEAQKPEEIDPEATESEGEIEVQPAQVRRNQDQELQTRENEELPSSPGPIDLTALLEPDQDEGPEESKQPENPDHAPREAPESPAEEDVQSPLNEREHSAVSTPMEAPDDDDANHPPEDDDVKMAEPTPEPESAEVEEEEDGASSSEEPLQKSRKGSTSRRGRPPKGGKAARRRRQSSVAVETISEVDESSPAPEPMPTRRQGKRRASVLEEVESPRDRKRARDGSEPTEEEESGPAQPSNSRARRRAEAQTPAKKFQNVIGLLHSQISQHRNGTIFHHPIRETEAPDYRDIVKRPMDLKTIKARIRDGNITNSQEFQRDIYLMFANAMMYNRPGSDVYVMAEDMMIDCENYIQTFRQTEGFVRGAQR